MRKIISLGAFLIWGVIANTSEASGPNVWEGTYFGMELGEATNKNCSQWTLPGANGEPQTIGSCGSGSVVGGVQFGDNFQYKRVFWGLAADIDFATVKKLTQSLVATGTLPPAGSYFGSERLSPNGFLIIAPRLGYAGHEWAPYVRAGGLVAFGGRTNSLSYRQVTTGTVVQPTVSFNGERDFDTIGWVAGGGMEWGLLGPWSVGFEFMRADLGRGSNNAATCMGAASICERFSGMTFENSHSAFKSNIFRASATYYFDYW